MAKSKPRTKTSKTKVANNYRHPESESLMRPDVGTQAQFKKKPPKKYRYDDSLSPSLEWDGQNPARERGEALIKEILDAKLIEEAKDDYGLQVEKLPKPPPKRQIELIQ
jgi:adenine-specific DNA-methyltransferase